MVDRHPYRTAPGLACVVLCLSGAALAQDGVSEGGGGPRAPEANRLERVEINSRAQSDTELRRRQPVAKTIYGREELDKYGDNQLSDVLKRLPGVNVQSGAVQMRGLGSGYTQVLINGEPAPPGFSMDNLNPAQVERIEVSKAPTADQSAQAIAGTINIVLKDAPRQVQRDLRLGLGYNAERPTPSATATYGDRFGPLSVVLPLSAYQWRFRNATSSDRDTFDQNGDRLKAHIESKEMGWGGGFNFGPRLNWRLGDGETLSWQSFVQRNEWNNQGRTITDVLQGTPTTSVDDRYLNTGSWQMLRSNLQWIKRFGEGQRIELKLGGQLTRSRYTTDVDGDDGQGVQIVARHTDGDNKERSLSQGGKYSQTLGEEHTLTLGWDLESRRRDEVRTVTENGESQLADFEGLPFRAKVLRSALFIQDEWEINPQWSTYLGLRSERIATTSKLSDDGISRDLDNSSHVLSPLWHLNYKLDPKGRDLVRASLTRSYKAPDLSALMPRPTLNTSYPRSGGNTELAPDRIGNPLLKPELATGLDVAYEKYFAGGGMASIGVFHRNIKNLIRNVISLEDVSWSDAQRWVSRPSNLRSARTSGIELELKGRAGELLPSLFEPSLNLNLRGALSIYRSSVDGLPGPNNRLEQQQPYSVNLGADYRLRSLPLTVGGSLAFTPGYATQQTATQLQALGRARTLDLFAQYLFSRSLSLRLAANTVAPLDTVTDVYLASGQSTHAERHNRTFLSANLEMKF